MKSIECLLLALCILFHLPLLYETFHFGALTSVKKEETWRKAAVAVYAARPTKTKEQVQKKFSNLKSLALEEYAELQLSDHIKSVRGNKLKLNPTRTTSPHQQQHLQLKDYVTISTSHRFQPR